jgi:NDP-sugar pyrophosphorylase family protein
MRAGIIAAGLGVRLGGGTKALTLVGGRTLIDHVLDGLEAAGAEQVTCIVNESSAHVAAHVAQSGRSLPIDWIVRSTPSSMHSFLAVLERLSGFGDPRYVISTVDAVCAQDTMVSFARRAAALPDADLVLGLTDVIDDEKPLYVDVERPDAAAGSMPPVDVVPDAWRVRALGAEAADSRFVTAGLYAASARILFEKDAAVAAGFTALRQFLGHVVSRGYRVYGVPLAPVIDVDWPSDVKAAEGLFGRLAPAKLRTRGSLS